MTAERRRYQQEVANLLDRIRQGVERLERLRARGVRGPALADDEAELDRVRGELAAVVRKRQPLTAARARAARTARESVSMS